MNPILIIDDDPDYREFVQAVLARHGLAGVEAADGLEALDHLRCRSFSGIIVDLVMAGMDGLEVIQAIRRIDRTVPILLLTGGCIGQTNPYVRAALAMGADLAGCKGGSELEPICTLAGWAQARAA